MDDWVTALLEHMMFRGYVEQVNTRSVLCSIPHFSLPKPHATPERRVVSDFRF